MNNVLITGIRGFIGFNAIQLWTKEHPELNFVGLDAKTYADNFMIIAKNKWLADHGIVHYNIDLSKDIAMLEDVISKHSIDTIVNFAAESHVDNSIKNPNIFFQSNVIGTVNLLNVSNKYGIRFHQIGTDEVYGETMPNDWIHSDNGKTTIVDAKDKMLVPSSPYSSSKASADMIALSYHHTFGTKATISRCTNNAGKWQHSEKLIGTTILKALTNQKIPVYGEGTQRRHWIDVDDHNRAIFKILEDGTIGKIYNIGPIHENWITNIELIKFILSYLKKSEDLIEHVADRLGHDTSYYLIPSNSEFKTRSYKEFMPEIIDWYQANLQI